MLSGYFCQVIVTTRVATVNDVEKLHIELKNDPRFDLKKFEYTHKEVKQKGEVVDEYEFVKATLIFNNEKEPDSIIKIDFHVDNGYFPEPVSKDEDEEELED